MAYAVDDSRWPVVTVRPTELVNDIAALDGTYRALELLLARRQRFRVLLDLRGGASSPRRRQRFLDWGKRHAIDLTSYLAAIAIVVGTSFERGIVTAVTWMYAPPWALRVFSDRAEAETWLASEPGPRG